MGNNYQKRTPEQSRAYTDKYRSKKGVELIACGVCGRQFEFLGRHIKSIHGMNASEYRELCPGQLMMSDRMRVSRGKGSLVTAKRTNYDGIIPDNTLFEFLTGTMLGDGSIEQMKLNARYAEGGNNELYIHWKYELLSQYFPCSFTGKLSSPHTKSGKQYQGWWLKTTSHPFLTEWKNLWYQPKKIVPHDLIERYLTEFSLAVWFCDDGHMRQGEACIYTMAFSDDDVQWLSYLLRDRFSLNCHFVRNQKKQPYLTLYGDSARSIASLLRTYNIPGMAYKSEACYVIKKGL